MKVQRSHLRIAVIVLVAAVLYNLWVFMRPSSGPAAPAQAPLLQSQAPPAGGAEAPGVDPMSIPAPPPVDTSALTFSRDPFLFGDESRTIRPRAEEAAGPDPVVRSILFSSTRRSALVDNKVVGIGDAVGLLKVVDIERSVVVFADAGGTRRRVSMQTPRSTGIRR